MAHYIDADSLRAEIEKDRKKALDATKRGGLTISDIVTADVLAEVLLIIEQLQQEQTDFPITDEQIKEFLATHPKIEVPEKYKNPDWLFKKQEQPEVDLEKEIGTYFQDWTNSDDYGQALNAEGECVSTDEIIDIARHFAKWGAEHAKIDVTDFCKPIDPSIAQCIADHSWEMLGEDEKPVPNDLEEAAEDFGKRQGLELRPFANKFIIAGAKWDREQIMSEVVEGEITKDNRGNNVVRAGVFNKDFEYGDKVRIIVCKKED